MDTMYRNFMDWHERTMAKGDPRVEGWFLMSSPVPSTLLSVLYIVLVLASMRWMKTRPAFDLRPLMVGYNLSMVVFSAWLVYEFCMSGWLTGYTLGCQLMDYSWSPMAVRMTRVCWWFYFSKFIEMIDTFFFIFRGRFELVTFLHVFHHAVLPPAWWWGAKFAPGGLGSFAALLNSVVHAVMYLYYGLAAMGPQMQPYLWWKRYLTKFQMTQFVIIVAHNMQLYFTDCEYPKFLANWIMGFACIFFILFANYYIQEYIKRASRKAQLRQKEQAQEHANGVAKSANGAAAAHTNGHHKVSNGKTD